MSPILRCDRIGGEPGGKGPSDRGGQRDGYSRRQAEGDLPAAPSKEKGTGLGLFITDSIVRQLNGRNAAFVPGSRVGLGLSFWRKKKGLHGLQTHLSVVELAPIGFEAQQRFQRMDLGVHRVVQLGVTYSLLHRSTCPLRLRSLSSPLNHLQGPYPCARADLRLTIVVVTEEVSASRRTSKR